MNILVHNPSIVKLVWFYFYQGDGYLRIERSQTMSKYKDAYFEAADHLMNLEYFNKKFLKNHDVKE